AEGRFIGNGTIPVGGIIMWSGLAGNVPSGWQLCNGSQIPSTAHPNVRDKYTPDLRGRFIVGFDSDASTTPEAAGKGQLNYGAMNNIGGENSHLLTSAESALPSHKHEISPNPHNHNDGDYNELLNTPGIDVTRYTVHGGNDTRTEPELRYTRNLQPATLSIADRHIPTATESHENRPPYYVLAFIMRIR
ncbi:MAG: tail fiber protein, partial [Bacteroidales bacterium]|nr:tail fiber protein [Bacteroidales bacterium]